MPLSRTMQRNEKERNKQTKKQTRKQEGILFEPLQTWVLRQGACLLSLK